MVGIGGVGMSSIAEVLLNRGYEVTGSDLQRSEATDRLVSLGAVVREGHAAENVRDTDVVVYSSAVARRDNPETVEAERLRIPAIPRSAMLGELMRMQFGVGVAGTHGKTTTTSMVGLVVAEGGYDPTIIVGGKVAVFGSNAVVGEGNVIVIEADEYDRTFLRLTPSLAVVTNIEAEHLDTYRDLDDIKQAFAQFANSVPFFGAAVLCLDDPVVQEIVSRIDRRVITYGLSRQAEVRADKVWREGPVTRFHALRLGERLGEITLHAAGGYNVRNALAAVAVGVEMEIGFDKIRAGIGRFTGVQRRFQTRGEAAGVLVVDDYAHHPTEIVATLETAHEMWPDKRIIAAFQPHLYTRTRDFLDDFAKAFFNADMLVLTDVYAAREAPLDGVDGQKLANLAKKYGHRQVHYVPDRKEVAGFLAGKAREGDVVVSMGAGDIWRCSGTLLAELEKR